MSNERPDEFLSWRTRLDTPEALPGLSLTNKEAAWQRLQGRLQKKPVRRRFLWWSLTAAASILLLILLYGKENIPVSPSAPAPASAARIQHPATATPYTARSIPAQAPTTAAAVSIRPEHLAATSPSRKARPGRRPLTLPALSPADTTSAARPSPAGQLSPVLLASDIPVLHPAVTPRKTLRVVAANETGGPLRPPVSTTANQRFFRIDLGRFVAPGNPEPAGQETSPLLKIKFTNSN